MIGWGTNFRSRVSAVGSQVQVFWFGCGFRITPHLHLCLITRT
jgi:coproporphyrinogen III oxidase